jgi:hypothetical protein
LIPRSAKASAVAFPIPEVAPVINASLFFIFTSSSEAAKIGV